MNKAAFANNMIRKVQFGCIISEQTIQVLAVTEDHVSARKGGKTCFVPAPP